MIKLFDYINIMIEIFNKNYNKIISYFNSKEKNCIKNIDEYPMVSIIDYYNTQMITYNYLDSEYY